MAAEVQPGRTFAHEVSGRVRVIACLDDMPNIFHTDTDGEFSLFPEEQTAVRVMADAGPEDVLVLAWGPEEDVTTALLEITSRIREATLGVPSETRQLKKGGWTDFERLLPGPNRMYPDTDSPPTIITIDRSERIRAGLPEAPWLRFNRLREAGVSAMVADQLLGSPYFGLFWKIISDGPIAASWVARVFVQEVKAARRKGGRPELIEDDAWRKLFRYIRKGELLWEAVPHLVRQRSKRPRADWMNLATKQRVLPIPEKAWRPIVDAVLQLQPRSTKKDSRVRWLMGHLQNPPGRIPAQIIVKMVEERVQGTA